MSNSASLAAAKKRRSQPAYPQQQQTNQKIATNSSNNMNNQNRPATPTTPLQLLKLHDYRLFSLEKKYESNNEDLVTRREFELLQLDNSVKSKPDNMVSNKVENNCTEITGLKTNVAKLTKIVNEANMLMQTMRATILSQTNELNEIREFKAEFNKFIEENNHDDKEEAVECN